jgi:hypothetical protein
MHRAETTFCTLQVLHIERRVNGSELQPFRAQSCGKSSMNANFLRFAARVTRINRREFA